MGAARAQRGGRQLLRGDGAGPWQSGFRGNILHWPRAGCQRHPTPVDRAGGDALMSRQINPKEMESVLSLSGPERYGFFVQKGVEQQGAWGVRSAEGGGEGSAHEWRSAPSLAGPGRYGFFVQKVVGQQVAWGLRSEEGWVLVGFDGQ